MFIREVKKQRSKDSKAFYQYNLVQITRIEGKVKQNVILYLGSDPQLADKDNRKIVLDILKSKIFMQPDIFPNDVPGHLHALACTFMKSTLSNTGGGLNRTGYPPRPHPKGPRCTMSISRDFKWPM
jgi:hypothetical protein